MIRENNSQYDQIVIFQTQWSRAAPEPILTTVLMTMHENPAFLPLLPGKACFPNSFPEIRTVVNVILAAWLFKEWLFLLCLENSSWLVSIPDFKSEITQTHQSTNCLVAVPPKTMSSARVKFLVHLPRSYSHSQILCVLADWLHQIAESRPLLAGNELWKFKYHCLKESR